MRTFSARVINADVWGRTFMKYRFQPSPYTEVRAIEGVSVTQAGRIGLPKFFLTTQSIQRGTKAYLYWDAENRAIAIEFTRQGDATAFPIVFTQHYGAFITARRFFQAHGLNSNAYAGRYAYARKVGAAIGVPEAESSLFVIRFREE
jgi:hypothetical protein